MKDFLKFTFATITGIIVSVVVLVFISILVVFSIGIIFGIQKRKYAKTPL